MTLSTGQVLNSRYRIVKLLGQGGFGAVYRAWDLNLNQACALKENLDTSPEASRQFSREATVLARLAHPNLPRVTDHFTIPGQGQYLVMDYVEGDDLEHLVQREGPVSPEQAISWISQVADALTYLHGQNPPVLHRDIKPANIRVTPDGRAMLVDFGLVKFYDPNLRTTMGARAVTPGYSPPEQYGKGNTDARTDIYALGATMYNILTGQDPPESVQRLAGESLQPVNKINPAINKGLGTMVEHAMSLTPSQRYQTIADFQTDLAAAAGSSTRPVSKPVVKPISKPVKPAKTKVSQPGVLYRPKPVSTPAPAVEEGGRKRPAWLLWAILGVIAIGLVGFLGLDPLDLFGGGAKATDTPAEVEQVEPTSVEVAQTASFTAVATRTSAPTRTSLPVPGVLDIRVAQPADDVEQNMGDGAMNMNRAELNLVDDPAGVGKQMVGLRFTSVNIPPGAVIKRATIEFKTRLPSSGPASLVIHGQASDNPPPFAATANNLSDRPTTSAGVNWEAILDWNTVGATQVTPDLAPILQELVNLPGWQAGNSVVFMFDGTGQRIAYAFDGNADAAPLLHVEFSPGTGASPTFTAGSPLGSTTPTVSATATVTPTRPVVATTVKPTSTKKPTSEPKPTKPPAPTSKPPTEPPPTKPPPPTDTPEPPPP